MHVLIISWVKLFFQGSLEEEHAMGENVAKLVSPENELIHVNEGDEPEEFWAGLGGKGDYEKNRDFDKPALSARLFHCTISPAGRLRVREVDAFAQEVRLSCNN